MKILVIDVGGTTVKILASGQTERRRMPSGTTLTPAVMVEGVKRWPQGWDYDVVSIGYPGVVRDHQPVTEPHNLARGWVGFDYAAAFGKPVKHDQRCGHAGAGQLRAREDAVPGPGHRAGLGDGGARPGAADGAGAPALRGTAPSRTMSARARCSAWAARSGVERVVDVAQRLAAALVPDELVLGGGNAKLLGDLPAGLPRRRQRQRLHRRLQVVAGHGADACRQRAATPRNGTRGPHA